MYWGGDLSRQPEFEKSLTIKVVFMFRKGSHKAEEYFGSRHRFEHWYCDNMVYFITARCRDKNARVFIGGLQRHLLGSI